MDAMDQARKSVVVLAASLLMYTAFSPSVLGDDWTQTSESDFLAGSKTFVDALSDPGNLTLSMTWMESAANPLLSLGPGGTWDDEHVTSPSVVFDGATYHMWYAGHDGANWRIGYATSSDGVTWTRAQTDAVLDLGPNGDFDDVHVYGPTVILEGNTFNMWYTGYDGGAYRIGYAISTNGINWTKNPGNPILNLGTGGSWDDAGLLDSMVVKNGSKYLMWYSGSDGSTWRIGHATSNDGLVWTKSAINPVFSLGPMWWESNHVQSPGVLFNGVNYEMWYTGSNSFSSRIGHATSPDGINWTRSPGNPTFNLGPGGTWDDGHLSSASTILYGGRYKAWFGGHDGGNWRIGTAEYGHSSLGTFVSVVFDSHAYGSFWNYVTWTGYQPAGTNISFATRTGDTVVPNGSWSAWSSEMWNSSYSAMTSPRSRYIQYRASLTTTDYDVTPILSEVNVNYTVNTATAPNLTQPGNNTWIQDNVPNMTWSYSDAEGDPQGGFEIHIDDNSSFSTIDFIERITNSNESWWKPSSPIPDGIWFWRVRTQDALGQWGEYSEASVMKIDTIPPTAYAGPDLSVKEDDRVFLNGSATFDLGVIAYYNWSFGDGDHQNGTDPVVTHVYGNEGVYVVGLNVTDMAGFWDLDYASIYVDNVNPGADAGEDQTVFEGELVIFNGNGTTDTPSDELALIYTWYFGDGMVGSGKSTTHAYDDDGVFVATLVVLDDDGATSSDTLMVTVLNLDPSIAPVPPQTGTEGVPYTLQILATDVGGDTVSFSDDSTLFEINSQSGIISFVPTDADVGVHAVNIDVVDEDGGASTANFALTILNVNDAPVITSAPTGIGIVGTEYRYDIVVWDDDFLTPSGDQISYGLDRSPSGMSVDASGHLTWTPTTDQEDRSWDIIVNVSDGEASDLQTFVIAVQGTTDTTNRAPELHNPEVTVSEGIYLFKVTYLDADGDEPSKVLVVIDGADLEMSRDSDADYINGTTYTLELEVPAGRHTYWFKAHDAEGKPTSTSSAEFRVTEQEEYDWIPMALLILLMVVLVFMIVQQFLMRRKQTEEKEPPETEEG
jgi:predicted GH43/DUF377 family glycosyl hydrolase